MNSGTLNILLTNGKLFTKTMHYTAVRETYALNYQVLHMLIDHNINTKLVQSIWYQDAPINITLEDLDLG